MLEQLPNGFQPVPLDCQMQTPQAIFVGSLDVNVPLSQQVLHHPAPVP